MRDFLTTEICEEIAARAVDIMLGDEYTWYQKDDMEADLRELEK